MENDLNKKVVEWGKARNIVGSENTPKQFIKVIEEVGELSAGINKRDEEKIIDSMGDIQVTLILLAADLGIDYNGSLEAAYNVIANRKGKTVNGVFIKKEDIK
ncbi:MazG-like family protein [Leuconostoc mesenteroides]|uniref:MazG-like family protein n=1 Tax=Leuconostoc mesenteroides TaxID=1245 RepID=UPI001CBD91A5|nr:MazG-like family protein [Leuconostoc mesenteroides]MBZ1529778.1 MazG-like family protein [Leuconostoc mesenteroides]